MKNVTLNLTGAELLLILNELSRTEMVKHVCKPSIQEHDPVGTWIWSQLTYRDYLIQDNRWYLFSYCLKINQFFKKIKPINEIIIIIIIHKRLNHILSLDFKHLFVSCMSLVKMTPKLAYINQDKFNIIYNSSYFIYLYLCIENFPSRDCNNNL